MLHHDFRVVILIILLLWFHQNSLSFLFILPPSVADCKNNTAAEEQKQLALLVMETLTVLLQGFNNTNAGKLKKRCNSECCDLWFK